MREWRVSLAHRYLWLLISLHEGKVQRERSGVYQQCDFGKCLWQQFRFPKWKLDLLGSLACAVPDLPHLRGASFMRVLCQMAQPSKLYEDKLFLPPHSFFQLKSRKSGSVSKKGFKKVLKTENKAKKDLPFAKISSVSKTSNIKCWVINKFW